MPVDTAADQPLEEGWVDRSETGIRALKTLLFFIIARVVETLGLVYPSCAEGGGGSALTCMHAGLVPVINREVSVDLDPGYGVELTECSIPRIRETVRELAERPASELEEMARGAWSFARARHTQETFQAGYRAFAERLTTSPSR